MWPLLARLVAGGVARAEGAEVAAGAMGAAESAATGAMVKKKLSDAMTPANDDAKAAARNDPHAVAQPSPSYGLVNNIPQFGATATGPTHVNDNAPMVSAGSSMFDSSQVINLLTTSVALLRNIVNGIEQQAQMAKDSAKALRESQLERADKVGAITSEAQDGVAGNPDEGIGKALAALGIGAAGVWGLKQLDTLATKSADQLTDYFSDHLSKFLGSFIEDLPKTMMKFMMGVVGGNPAKGVVDGVVSAITGDSSAGTNQSTTGPSARGFGGRDPTRIMNYEAKAVGYSVVPQSVQTLGQASDFAKKVNRAGAGSSAMGTYQIVGQTLRGYAPQIYGKDWRNQAYNQASQDRIAKQIFEDHRHSASALKKQWVSLSIKDAERIRKLPWEQAREVIAKGESGASPAQIEQSIRQEEQKRSPTTTAQAQAYTKPTPELMKRPEAQKAAPRSLLLKPGAKPLDVNPWAAKPVARSSFTAEQPAFGSMFGPLNVNPIESTRNQIERQTDPSGLLERILGAGNFSGARIQAPKLGQIDNVMMSVLRDIVESQRQPTSEPSVAPTVTMPVITQNGSSQTPSAMSLNVPSPGKPLSTMSWDMYFDTQRGL